MSFVKAGDQSQIIGPRLGDILLGLEIFQDNSHAELFAFLCQAQTLGGGDKVFPRGGELIPERLHSGLTFHHFADHLVSLFLCSEPGAFKARRAGPDPAGIKQAARSDAPGQSEQIILRRPEMIGAAVRSAAKSAKERLSVQGWNSRSIEAPFLAERAAETSA